MKLKSKHFSVGYSFAQLTTSKLDRTACGGGRWGCFWEQCRWTVGYVHAGTTAAANAAAAAPVTSLFSRSAACTLSCVTGASCPLTKSDGMCLLRAMPSLFLGWPGYNFRRSHPRRVVSKAWRRPRLPNRLTRHPRAFSPDRQTCAGDESQNKTRQRVAVGRHGSQPSGAAAP